MFSVLGRSVNRPEWIYGNVMKTKNKRYVLCFSINIPELIQNNLLTICLNAYVYKYTQERLQR